MKFDTVIIGGGLAGLTAGLSLQKAGRRTAIISTGQSALHFFSGTFESIREAPDRMLQLFSEAGIRLHWQEGVRLMPLGTFREADLALEDIDIFPTPKIGRKALILGIPGYHDFFASFLSDGLAQQGLQCRIRLLNLPELEQLQLTPSEMRSVQIARIMDRNWEKVVQEIRLLTGDEDVVVLPQVFGLRDASLPDKIRQGVPARVVFAGTLPPSVPGIRTQMLLKQRYQLLGGTLLSGDEVLRAHVHEGRVHSIVTRNLDSHYIEGDDFVLATGTYFSKGLKSNPFQVSEPIFGLDVDYEADRNAWYSPSFADDQPYMRFGVKSDAQLHAVKDGTPMENLFVAGSILGRTRPEFGTAAGQAVRTALAVADFICPPSPAQA